MLNPSPAKDLVACSPAGVAPSRELVNEWYIQLSDLIIQEPDLTVFQLGSKLGKSGRWIAIIKNSDTFTDFHKKRYDEHVTGIRRKTETLVEMALDTLIDRVETIGVAMKTDELQEIVDKGSKRLGYGPAASSPNLAVTVNAIAVGRDDLESARQRMQEKFGVLPEPPARVASGAAAPQVVPAILEGEFTEEKK